MSRYLIPKKQYPENCYGYGKYVNILGAGESSSFHTLGIHENDAKITPIS